MAASYEPFTLEALRLVQDQIRRAQEREIVIICEPARADAIAAALKGRPGKVTVKTSRRVEAGTAYIVDVTPGPFTDRYHDILVTDLTDPPRPPVPDPLELLRSYVDG